MLGTALYSLLATAAPASSSECDACASTRAEHCEIFPNDAVCGTECGFELDAASGLCWESGTTPPPPLAAPIIGGSGKFRYQYMPDLLKAPTGATLVNCHGLSVDANENIILTYQNDGKTDPHCLITWKPDGTGGEFAAKDTPGLCSGTPHGLKITTEGGAQFLYHANNAKKLAKTTLDGDLVWIVDGPFGQDMTCGPEMCPSDSCHCTGTAPNLQAPYIPTWFATPPDTPYMYLCDGYGSDRVFAFESRTGAYMNVSWGGRSPAGLHPGVAGAAAAPHGTFMENHGCTYDPRPTTEPHTIVVSDRRNMRFEFYHYDPASYKTFKWYKSVDMQPSLGPGTLPCNMRMTHGSKLDPTKDGRSVVPDLNGPVAVLDSNHTVLSVVNVSVLLAAEQHKHPHDAIFLANGDIVVATWAPGRVSYWKKLPVEE